MVLTRIRRFIEIEENASYCLFLAFILALFASNNINIQNIYFTFTHHIIETNILSAHHKLPLIKIINESLMSLFFLMISLEMKYQILYGEFSNHKKLLLPAITALGAAIVPALIYSFFNYQNPILAKGWAIPISTDTAFVLGIFALFSKRIPNNARIFIIGFSLMDDAISIGVLAIFYSSNINPYFLILVFISVFCLFLLNKYNIRKIRYYIVLGIILWLSIFLAGITATFCGVLLAFFIPANFDQDNTSIAKDLEKKLHPTINYIILPIFVFLNSGIAINDLTFNEQYATMTIGVILGLAIGKPMGFLIMAGIGLKFLKASIPENITTTKFVGIAFLTGFGYVINLYIGDVAFDGYILENQMRFSVLAGSFLSALIGGFILIR